MGILRPLNFYFLFTSGVILVSNLVIELSLNLVQVDLKNHKHGVVLNTDYFYRAPDLDL
jgi:hypothetical protein